MARPQDKRILVVDDEPNVREYLAQILLDAGFNVDTAGDGVEAMEKIQEDPPDFISLDLVMPRKSGHKFLYELRKDRKLASIPVLIVTAHARDEMGEVELKDIVDNRIISGPGVYLEKPVKPRDYVRCVSEALGVERIPAEGDREALQEELKGQLDGAEPHALRRALAALKGKSADNDE